MNILKTFKSELQSKGFFLNEHMFCRHYKAPEEKPVFNLINQLFDNQDISKDKKLCYFIKDNYLFLLTVGDVQLESELFHHKQYFYKLYSIDSLVDKFGVAFNHQGKSLLLSLSVFNISVIQETKTSDKLKLMNETKESYRPLSKLINDSAHNINSIKAFFSLEEYNDL